MDDTHPTPQSRRSRKAASRLALGLALCVALGLAALALAYGTLSSPESRDLGRELSSWIAQSSRGAVVEADLSIVSVQGLPGSVAGHSASLAWRSPDLLHLRTEIAGEELHAGREGGTVWIHLPGKDFTVVGDDTVPRFTGDPSSVEAVALPDFAIPLSPIQVRLLPFVLAVERMDGSPSARRISPSRLGRRFLDLPDFVVEIGEAERGGRELKIALTDQQEIVLRVDRFGVRDESLPARSWSPPEGETVERVALSHLVRCAGVLRSRIGAESPSLPPATGRREIVAASGKGRLEDHDGVRVLFLEGKPDEMGRQQGELLRDEVRSIVDRIVYGVGVGSSFAKGRWFFGEIEEAQSRIEPFIPESQLREMDAIAEAAGLHRQEARLANFFPELFHCSGFALHGSATLDGRIYHGRILDYIRGAGLEDNAVVVVCRPEGGNAWVNLTYAGFVGSVTAMNEKKLAIGEMGGRGEGHWDGKPMAQLVREVMEQCDTIDEAVELMRKGPRTCEYYYVISDAKSGRAVGIKATPEIFETVWSGESHPQLPDPVADTVLLSAGERYAELVKRVKAGFGRFDADKARELMTRPVCMKSNIQSVLFAPDTLDFWVANADSENVASETRYTHFNLAELLGTTDEITQSP